MIAKRWAFVLLFSTCLTLPALAQDDPTGPDDQPRPGVRIVQRCLTELHQATHNAVRAMLNRTGPCVGRINAAQEEGNAEAAAEAAATCTEQVDSIAERATTRLAAIVERCVAILTEREAPETAITRIEDAGAARTQHVSTVHDEAVQRIADALSG